MEQTDPVHLCRLLCVDGERRREQAQGEHHDAPNGAVPHGRLLAWVSYRPASSIEVKPNARHQARLKAGAKRKL
jgi:hypothetical protein